MSGYPFDVTFAKPLNKVIRKSSLNLYNFTEQKPEQSTYNKKHVWALFIGHEFEIIYLVLAILWLWSKIDNVAPLPVHFSPLCYFFMLYLENNNQRQFQALNPFCFHHIVLNTEQIQLVVSLSSCYSDVLHLWRQHCLLLCSSDNLEMWCWNFISIDGNTWGFCQVIPVFPGVPQNK